MKSEQVFRHIKLVLLGVTVAFVMQIIFASEVRAQVDSLDLEELQQQVDDLKVAVASLGQNIAFDQSTTRSEKIVKLKKLVTILQTLVQVQVEVNAQRDILNRALEDVSTKNSLSNDELGLSTQDVTSALNALEAFGIEPANLDEEKFITDFDEHYAQNGLSLDEESRESLVKIVNDALSDVDFVGGDVVADEEFVTYLLESLGFRVE